MGNAAGLKALHVLDNVERALAIELLAGAQAIEFLAPLEPGRRRARGARRRARRSRPARRGPAAERRTSSASPRRSGRRDRRGRRVARSGRSRDGATDARVEALCGDLCAIRAPRGSALNARSWQTEAPLRMLLNNLDPEVAEHPEHLVVYGGSGRAARSHDALRGIVRDAAPAPRRRDAARPERQAGRRVPHARVGAARADRELAARPALGDLGRVPAARGRGPDDVRPDDRRELDLHRHAGDPAGHVPDVRGGGRAALRLGRPERAHDPHRGARRAWAARSRWPRRWPAPRSSASRSTRPGSSAGSRRGTSTRSPTRSTTRSREFAPPRPRGVRSRSDCSGTRPTVFPELAARGEHFDFVTDQTAAHDPLTGYVPAEVPFEEAAALRARDPDGYLRLARESIVAHVRAMIEFVRRGLLRLRLWQQPAGRGP